MAIIELCELVTEVWLAVDSMSNILHCQTPNPKKKNHCLHDFKIIKLLHQFLSRLLGTYNADMENHIVFCKISFFTGMQLLALQRA